MKYLLERWKIKKRVLRRASQYDFFFLIPFMYNHIIHYYIKKNVFLLQKVSVIHTASAIELLSFSLGWMAPKIVSWSERHVGILHHLISSFRCGWFMCHSLTLKSNDSVKSFYSTQHSHLPHSGCELLLSSLQTCKCHCISSQMKLHMDFHSQPSIHNLAQTDSIR